jgi:hypothetical protein
MPFGDEPPTTPETWRAVLRLMAERVRASDPADIAVLQSLREAAATSREDTVRYMRACMEFVERLLE